MNKLTANQQRFVQGMAQGLPQKQAALLAGYAPGSAQVTASQLMARPDIKAAIRAAKKTVTQEERKATAKAAEEKGIDMPDEPLLKDKYESPGELMFDAMNNPRVPVGVRLEMAKQLLPYYHARVGEKGKKDTAKDRAAEIANGDKKSGSNVTSMFQKRAAPKLQSA